MTIVYLGRAYGAPVYSDRGAATHLMDESKTRSLRGIKGYEVWVSWCGKDLTRIWTGDDETRKVCVKCERARRKSATASSLDSGDGSQRPEPGAEE